MKGQNNALIESQGWLTMKEMIEFEIAIMVYKSIHICVEQTTRGIKNC